MLAALACLVAAKLANVGVPLVMKEVVDSLDREPRCSRCRSRCSPRTAFSACRRPLFTELREFLFAKVTQRAVRNIALKVFRHLHALSLRFHLARQTGGLTRDVERGQRGISTLIQYALFSILPTRGRDRAGVRDPDRALRLDVHRDHRRRARELRRCSRS